jgi:CBS domain-containing protein
MTTKIRDIMTSPPVCMAPYEAVSAAAMAMRDLGIGCVLVKDDGEIRGILTDRDITVRVLADARDPATTEVGAVCSSELVLLGPDDDAASAVELIEERAIRRIPVVEDGIPVGVVSLGDLSLESGEQSVLADVSAAPPNI